MHAAVPPCLPSRRRSAVSGCLSVWRGDCAPAAIGLPSLLRRVCVRRVVTVPAPAARRRSVGAGRSGGGGWLRAAAVSAVTPSVCPTGAVTPPDPLHPQLRHRAAAAGTAGAARIPTRPLAGPLRQPDHRLPQTAVPGRLPAATAVSDSVR